jgi:3-oxoacyl-[acyl-carrier protein] reductase
MTREDDRIALVTGGASGLGLASAQRLAGMGLRIIVADIDRAGAERAAAGLPGEGHLGVALDISDEAAVSGVFDLVEKDVGPVAVLANFAGVLRAGQGDFSLAGLSLDEWNGVFAINAAGSFLATREMARRRPARPVAHGRIILVSSVGGQVGGFQSSPAYLCSKGSILTLIKAAARELAPHGITVNGIAPGPIDTPMLRAATAAKGGNKEGFSNMSLLPLGRIGTPEELAAATAYLASREAGFVTGSVMDVNGGMRMQ